MPRACYVSCHDKTRTHRRKLRLRETASWCMRPANEKPRRSGAFHADGAAASAQDRGRVLLRLQRAAQLDRLAGLRQAAADAGGVLLAGLEERLQPVVLRGRSEEHTS